MKTALLIAIGVLVVLPAAAIAKPRVALVAFEGDPGGEAQDVVSDARGEDGMSVGPKQVNRTVDKLGLDTHDLAEKYLRKLSKELQAAAVIKGKLSRKGDNKPMMMQFSHACDDVAESVSSSVAVEPASTARPANRVAVRLDLGVAIQNRSLTFTSRSYPQAPKPFNQKPVAGARVAGEIYPLAFGNPTGVGGGLGLGGMFDQTIVLNLQSTAQPGTKFPVTQRRFDIGPRFRLLFGHSDTSPSVTLGVGYMKRTFVVNRTGLTAGNTIDLPDVDYAGFAPGIEFRIPLVKQVALVFGGQAILLTSAGPIQGLDSDGQAKVSGGAGSAGFDIVLGNHLAISLRGAATQLGYAFTGNGTQSNNRDMDPTTKDIGGAADRYLGAAATIAILY